MIRWVVLFLGVLGFLGVVALGRIFKRSHHFFWRRIVVTWGLLALTAIVAVLPLTSSSSAQRVSNRDIIFVIDITQSMNAADGRGGNETTRLENVRDDIATIAKANIGASVGMFTFADATSLYLPLTPGSEDIGSAIDTIYTATQFQAVPKIATYTSVFEELGKYLSSQQQVDPTRQRTVIFMSDFEIFNNQEQTEQIVSAATAIKTNNASFTGLVYGEDNGAKMLNMRYDYETGEQAPNYKKYPDDEYGKYLYDKGKAPVSKPNPDLASKLASSLGGISARAEDEASVMPAANAGIKRAESTNASNPQSLALRQNSFYIIPAALVFVWLCMSEFIRPKWLDILAGSKTKRNVTPKDSA